MWTGTISSADRAPLSLTHRNHTHRTYKFTFESLPRLTLSTSAVPLQDDFALSRVHAHTHSLIGVNIHATHTHTHTHSFISSSGKTKGKQYAHTQLPPTQPGHRDHPCSLRPPPPSPLLNPSLLPKRSRSEIADARPTLINTDDDRKGASTPMQFLDRLSTQLPATSPHNCQLWRVIHATSTRLHQTAPQAVQQSNGPSQAP